LAKSSGSQWFNKAIFISSEKETNISQRIFVSWQYTQMTFCQVKEMVFGLLNFKCLMTNHATFDNQLEHVSASCVQA